MALYSLQHVGSAGSPLSTELHEWFAANFPRNVGLFSGSGGTDLVGGSEPALPSHPTLRARINQYLLLVVSGNPMANLYRGEIAGPNLRMKVEIWNSEGRNIEETGTKGDLVITKPFFSMPIGFWGQEGDAKYRAAYFEQYPGVWYRDFIQKNPVTGGNEILGRSDGVLNPGGEYLHS
jgi:acetoacetyl-CoA synthetase